MIDNPLYRAILADLRAKRDELDTMIAILEKYQGIEPDIEKARSAMGIDDNTQIDHLPLSARTKNAMRGDGMQTVGDVRRSSQDDLLRLPNFGRKSLNELQELIGRLPPWQL